MSQPADPSGGLDCPRTREPSDPLVQRLMGILDRVKSLLLLVEADGTLSFWNEPAARRLGEPRHSPLGKPLEELVHPRDRRRVKEVMAEIFQEGPSEEVDDPRDIRFRLKGADGNWAFCIARPSLYRLPGSDTSVCLFSVREDTERRRPEAWQDQVQELKEEVESKTRRLAESMSDYHALIQAMNDGFCVLEEEGRITFVNEKFADLLGYSPAELIGGEAAGLFDEQNREIFFRQLHERRLGRQGTYEIEFIRQDGSRITCLMRAAPRYDPEGRHLGSICNVTDISVRKKLENLLRNSERDYRDLFENMQDVICRMTPEGKIVALNPAGARALGCEQPQDVLWRRLRSFFVRREDWDHLQAELGEKGVVQDFVVSLRRQDGMVVTMSINAHMVFDEKGWPAGIDGVFRDVSDRMRMEAQLQSYAADMEKKNEELEGLIYSITHDLKSPLMVVGGLLARLRRAARLLDGKHLEYLDWMQSNVARMEKMIGDLLVFYKADKTVVPFESVSVGPLVDAVLRDVEPLAREKGVRLRKKGAFPVVNGSRNRLYQVFYNLVENAVKFMDHTEEAVVEVGYEAREGEHLFCIRDNGPGIPLEHQVKVFQIFYTLEPERVSGTGIGLSIVKKIVENHGGRIWVESEVGKGTAFFFALPASGTD